MKVRQSSDAFCSTSSLSTGSRQDTLAACLPARSRRGLLDDVPLTVRETGAPAPAAAACTPYTWNRDGAKQMAKLLAVIYTRTTRSLLTHCRPEVLQTGRNFWPYVQIGLGSVGSIGLGLGLYAKLSGTVVAC